VNLITVPDLIFHFHRNQNFSRGSSNLDVLHSKPVKNHWRRNSLNYPLKLYFSILVVVN
jgi:hypothetical protein